jgi:hypothetical protein
LVKKITHYDSLGVARNAPTEVIRAAYKVLAQKNHPDKNVGNPDATGLMQAINVAYDVLSDTQKRADYDALLSREELQEPEPTQWQSQQAPPSSGNMYQTPRQSGGSDGPLFIGLLISVLSVIFFIYHSNSHVSSRQVVAAKAQARPAATAVQPKSAPGFAPRETSSQELAVCIFAAAKTYAVPPQIVLSLLSAEGGSTGEKLPVADRTYDLGPMHINSSWIPQLARIWGVSEDTALRMLRDDACINVGIGAWILQSALDKSGNDKNENLSNQISLYHAAAHHLRVKANDSEYVSKVMKLMELYKSIHSPEDLLGGAKK